VNPVDEVPPTVFQPQDGSGEFAIIIDRGDAPVLRDALKAAAARVEKRTRNVTQGHALRRNERQHRVLAKYAERFEHVRLAEAAAFVRRMREKEEASGN
jgi:hypothetical protein